MAILFADRLQRGGGDVSGDTCFALYDGVAAGLAHEFDARAGLEFAFRRARLLWAAEVIIHIAETGDGVGKRTVKFYAIDYFLVCAPFVNRLHHQGFVFP